MVNAQKAGLQIVPICLALIWNVLLIAPSMSPRMANTMDVVTSETQLARNSLPLCIDPPGAPIDVARRCERAWRRKLTKSGCLLHAEPDQGYTVHANACRTASFAG